ncbi:MAG: 3-hydroxyacyl-[acyl-carrier-protein] dehydratase, FabZ form, partial [Labilithrix sp.]|nr:3-hydroxyacyl-[acyl-carrier-protein] dehydratase, FabZ form [Labilithrix sp.]
MTAGTSLDIERILQILPHRWPFVMVDRVHEIVPHERIRGHKNVTMNEPWFLGHFPTHPIMPGVLVIEALAQIGGILAYASEPFDESSSLLYFLGI